MFSYFKSLLSFLMRKDYFFFSFLVLGMFLTAIIELAGVGSLFPYIKILGDKGMIHQSHLLQTFYSHFGFRSDDVFLIILGIAIFAMVLLKGGMTVFNNYFQTKFTSALNVRLSKTCFNSYLRMPYAKIISKNSSVLSKHLLVDVFYTVQVLTAILTITTDLFVAMALVGLMFFVDFKLILMVSGILLLFLMLSVKGTKNTIKRIGAQNETYNAKMFKVAGEALQGLKDVKVHQVESFFLRHYMHWRKLSANNQITYNVVSAIPATAMNVMGFGLLLAILLYLIFVHGNLAAVLPIIGVIAICIQRLMPIASRTSLQLGIIRQYQQNVTLVKKAVDMASENSSSLVDDSDHAIPIQFDKGIELRSVSYTYPSEKNYALNNINLQIKKGSSLGIVGSSGAGKTTLVDVLLGLLEIDSGDILCDGVSIAGGRHAKLCNIIGYVPQGTYLLDATVKENIAFGIEPSEISMDALNDAVEISQVDTYLDILPNGLDTVIGEHGVRLSGGQRQRIGIARALYSNPEILIMDEATNALDSVTENEFNSALSALLGKKTLIIIAHRHSSIKFCDELIVMENGVIADRGSHDYLSNESNLYQKLYQVDLMA